MRPFFDSYIPLSFVKSNIPCISLPVANLHQNARFPLPVANIKIEIYREANCGDERYMTSQTHILYFLFWQTDRQTIWEWFLCCLIDQLGSFCEKVAVFIVLSKMLLLHVFVCAHSFFIVPKEFIDDIYLRWMIYQGHFSFLGCRKTSHWPKFE